MRDAINIEQFEIEGDSSSRIFEKHQQPSPASANVESSEKNLSGNSSQRELMYGFKQNVLYHPARSVKWKKEYAGICEN